MKSIRAVWNGKTIAETDQTEIVEGNHYFHKDSINFKYMLKLDKTTHCPWKGDAHYYSVVVDGEVNQGAVWCYPDPSIEAIKLKDHFAFWNGVEILTETKEEREESISESTTAFAQDLAQTEKTKYSEINKKLSTFLDGLGADYLTHTLPIDFVTNLSFFNFSNSNDMCFLTDKDSVIRLVNPTFSWALNHLPNFENKSFEELIKSLEIVDGLNYEDFLKKVKSHGWARIPKLKSRKNDKDVYYSLDVAITKHGDIEELSGYQGQLTNISREVELSLSVENSKANMGSLLEGISEGLFFFDEKGIVAPERSSALAQILPGSESHESLTEILGTFYGKKEQDINMCLEMIFGEDDGFMSDFATTVTMLPQKMNLQVNGETKDLIFDYRPLYRDDDQVEKVITIVTDVTLKLKNEREALLQAERVRKVSRAAGNTEAFNNFIQEVTGIVSRVDTCARSSERDFNLLKRDLHTIKGSVATYDFTTVASLVHELEDHLTENPNSQTWPGTWMSISKQWNEEVRDIEQVLGLDQNRNKVSIPRDKIQTIFEYAKSSQDPKLVEMIESLNQHDLSEVFAKYVDYLAALCNREEFNKDLKINFDESSDLVAFDEIQRIDSALIHILRNCFDHGLEDRDDRLAASKNEQGQLHISCKREPSKCLTLTITDDGRGIDGDRLSKKAVDNEFWTQSQADNASYEDKIKLIFAAGLSTKDQISDVSGRGVGMDAVQAIITDMGGTIEIKSQLGEGTSFIIKFPGNEDVSFIRAA